MFCFKTTYFLLSVFLALCDFEHHVENNNLYRLSQQPKLFYNSKLDVNVILKIKRKHAPTSYYSNSTATFRPIIQLQHDVELNPGPTSQSHSDQNSTPRSMSFFYQNARSLKANYYDADLNCFRTKLSCFQDIAYMNNLDVLVLVETWLTNYICDKEILPVGYNIIRRDRRVEKRGGGVLLAVKETIKTETFNFDSDVLELVSVVIMSPCSKVLVAVCYRPPNSSNDFVCELNRFLKLVSESQFKDVVLIGDFNYPNVNWTDGSGFSCVGVETAFTNIIAEYNYIQLVQSPTRGNNIIDLVLTTNEHLIDNIEVTSDDCISLHSDHNALIFNLCLYREPKQSVNRVVYNYARGDFDGLVNALWNTPLLDIVQNERQDVNTAWSKWKNTFLKVVNRFIPQTNLKRSFTPPYITKDLLHAIKKKESLRRKAKASNTPELWDKFRKERQRLKCWIKAAKKAYISGLSESISNDSKPFWRFFKAKSSKSSLPDVMKHGDLRLSTSNQKADAFNIYFVSVFNNCNDNSPPVPCTLPESLDSIAITESQVQSLLRNLIESKATGPDGIPGCLLKRCSQVIAPSLCALFEISIESGVVPSEWKLANVVPVPKKGDTQEVTNYRPISLLSVVSKVLERVVFSQVVFFVKNSLYSLQHGFRSNRSSVTQLLKVLHDVGSALDSGREIDLIYLDFAKAFDSVPHKKLIGKLQSYGISGSLLRWFENYLCDRKQRVVVEGASSSFLDVTSGVPQGSVIGPLLFILYVNDLPDTTKSSTVALFADDSKCYRAIQSQTDRDLLQHDLDSMAQWSLTWQLRFNVSKSFLLRVSRKRVSSNYMYHLNNEPVTNVATHVDLGLIVSSELKWSPHIISCTAKANRMLGFLRRNCTLLTDIKCRHLLYLSLVRSHLSYGSEIWAPQGSSRDLTLLEGVQRRATKFILQNYELSYPERLRELKLLPISYWLELKDLIFFFKCLHGLFDFDISQFVTFSSNVVSRTRSNQQKMLKSNPCRTSLFRDSFFNRIVFLWNSLPLETRECSVFSTFKRKLHTHYVSKLDSTFDVDRMRTWKTYCSKCRSYNTTCCS